MPTPFNSNTFRDDYNDDWIDSAGYHRILFNSGRALQSRELNQLQTIIQEEITRFGKNIFKEGAAVSKGLMEIDNNYRYVRVTGNGVNAITPGFLLTGDSSGVTARVIQNVALGSNESRLYIRYTGSGSATPAETETQFVTSPTPETLNGGIYTVGGNSTDVGAGVRITVDSGDFFAGGRFVYAPKQQLILSATTRTFSGTVGFKIEQDVITINDTTALYDNTGDQPNVAAPGADRWRIRLTLVDKASITASDSFIFLCRIVNSKIVEQVDELDNYNIINDMMARRTYEESGNYLAEPFQLTFEDDDSTDSDIFAVIGPGLAYVRGYRVENQYPKKLKIKRPQKVETITNEFVAVDYGSYVLASGTLNYEDFAPTTGEVEVNLYNVSNVIQGTAHIKSIEKQDANTWRVYLNNITIDAGKDFDDVTKIGDTTSTTFNIEAGRLYEAKKQTNLFALPQIRPSSLSNFEYTYQRSYQVSASTGQGGGLAAGESYADETLWLVTDAAGAIETAATITDEGATFALSGTVGSGPFTVVANINADGVERRTKTRLQTTCTGTLSSGVLALTDTSGGPNNGQVIYDAYDVISVVDNSGLDVTDAFYLDNGQRDTHYEQASVIQKPNTATTGTVTVTFRWFKWSNDKFAGDPTPGVFFDVQSYGNIDYTEIPQHKLSDGTIISLRDYLDFRGKLTATNILQNQTPINAQPISCTASYYLSRADKLIATEDGEFEILMGQQAREPLFKKTPDNALELYKIVMNPNTLSPEDINTTFIEHKRYTMADIAKLERKLDALEESYTLSFAELEAKLEPKLDEATGTPVPDTGRQIDDFTDQTGSLTTHEDYCASIDPENKLLRPCFDGNNLRLVYRPDDGNSWTSKNVLIKGDNAYVNHTETSWIDQPLATRSVSINANSKIDYIGNLILSPSTDEWKSEQIGTRAIPGGNRLDTKEALLFNSWQWNWGGRAIEDLEIDPSLVSKRGRAGIIAKPRNISLRARRRLGGTGGHVNRVVSSETIRTVNNRGRVLDVAIIPWIRSRKIYFKATGLKPNTTFIPFFDGLNVSIWCKEEPFVRFSDETTATDIGNQGQQYNSGHPDGQGTLTTDGNGEVTGSFFIPNVPPTFYTGSIGVPTGIAAGSIGLRFKAGKKEFKLLDINVPDHNQAGSYAIATYDASGMIDTRKDGMTTTRMPKKIKQQESKIRRPYNVSELKDYLNSVAPGDVNLIEPHISGGWGGDASIPVVLGSLPNLSDVLSDYVSIDENSQAGSSTLPDQDVSYPFAQSFTVDNQFGVVLTKVDLYFETAATDLPVSIEIRNMSNGKPGSSVVPGTEVTVNPTISTSTDASVATTFTFDEPCYLDPGREYALVVKSQSSDYKIWIAEAGQFKIGSNDVKVSTQAANGKLFLPHSGSAGTSKELDLAFSLYRAVFDTNASLLLRNAVVPHKLLNNNPIGLTDNSTSAYVKHDCHGLDVGEEVVISGVPAGSYGSLTQNDLNGTRTVTAVDAHGFTFTIPDPNITGYVGGNAVLSSRNIQFAIANPQIETVVPNQTSIDVSARFTSGKSLGGSENKFVKETSYRRIVPDQNIEFKTPQLVAQRSEETDISGTISQNGGFSMDVKIDLKSANDYVAPIVDLQRASMTLIQNCIDNGVYIGGNDELVPYGSKSPAQHHTAPVETVEPSTQLEVKVDASVPNAANLDFYYRAVMSGQNILDQNWIKVEPKIPIVKEENPQVTHPIKIEQENLPKFTQSQIKTMMTSTDMIKIPQITGINIGTFL